MRTVITGGAGFVGSHLCDRFLAEGHEVLCVDNLLTGSRRNFEHLSGNPRFRFVEHNISDPVEVDGGIHANGTARLLRVGGVRARQPRAREEGDRAVHHHEVGSHGLLTRAGHDQARARLDPGVRDHQRRAGTWAPARRATTRHGGVRSRGVVGTARRAATCNRGAPTKRSYPPTNRTAAPTHRGKFFGKTRAPPPRPFMSPMLAACPIGFHARARPPRVAVRPAP